MHGAELQNVRDLQEHGLQEEERLQRPHRSAESEANAEVTKCGELVHVRELPVRYLRNQGRGRSHMWEGGEEGPRRVANEEECVQMR